MVKKIGWISSIFFIFSSPSFSNDLNDLCESLMSRYKEVRSYQCTYQAKTYYEGKQTETLMRYSYLSPNKIRMDIEKPKKGAVLIYNPGISNLVKVRPFPKLKFFVLNYALNDKKVSSDSGGTVDRSGLIHRAETICQLLQKRINKDSRDSLPISPTDIEGLKKISFEHLENGKIFKRSVTMDQNHLIRKIELFEENGKLIESYEWKNLEINPDLNPDLFKEF